MSILVVGSIALDTVETPYGNASDSPGGSALYFSAAASHFSSVKVVGVVGKDFDFSLIDFLKAREVNFDGLMVEEGQTFRWGGRYKKNMNDRDTLFTYLNVFESFKPNIPPHYQDTPFIFLANIDPELQLNVLREIKNPRLTVLDTMNFWISGKRAELENVLHRVDIVILNDEEIREYTGENNLFEAGKALLKVGPHALVIKKGENGALLMTDNGYFLAPAYPIDRVVDPTGAGDSFAGGFLGYLATCKSIDEMAFRQAVVYGTIVASYTVEDFSFSKLREISRDDIDDRYVKFQQMLAF